MIFTAIGAIGEICIIISRGIIREPGRMKRWSRSDCRAQPVRLKE